MSLSKTGGDLWPTRTSQVDASQQHDAGKHIVRALTESVPVQDRVALRFERGDIAVGIMGEHLCAHIRIGCGRRNRIAACHDEARNKRVASVLYSNQCRV